MMHNLQSPISLVSQSIRHLSTLTLRTHCASPSPYKGEGKVWRITNDTNQSPISTTMRKLLLLTPQLPYPAHQGTSLRNFHIIRGLADAYELTLLSFLEETQTAVPEKITPLLNLLTQLETVPVPLRTTGKRLRQLLSTRRPDMAHRLYDDAFGAKLIELLRKNSFAIVQIEGIELARYMEVVRTVSPTSKIVFDDHNAETELQRRNMLTDLRQPKRWVAAAYSWIQVQRLSRFERWALQNGDWSTAVSEKDKTLLQTLANDPAVQITAIPNCIDTPAYADIAEEPILFDLLFSGKMDYRPNVDGVLWFADKVWPGIIAKRPSTTWAIVGQKPHPRLARLRHLQGVTVTGWVQSVRPYLAGATVYVMPFRVGSGTRLKLIEAMAAGKAIVSTKIGAEGFPVTDGRELSLVDEATEMETAVLQLLDDEQRRKEYGRVAQQFAQAYDWRVVIPAFKQIYRRIGKGTA